MTHPIRTLLLARAVAYLNRYHLEDGALPWDEHHAEVHDLVEMIQGAAREAAKDLDPTGVCNWCGEECSNAFCRPECYRSYRGIEIRRPLP